MAGMQLRRYEVKPGELDAFVEIWRDLIAPRAKYGFSVRFAFLDDKASQFVWAVSHDGDFEAAEREYLESPERNEVLGRFGDRIEAVHVSMVRVEIEPS